MMTMSVQDYRQIAYFNLQFLPEKKCFNYFKHGGAKMIWLDVSYTIVHWQDWRSLESVEKKGWEGGGGGGGKPPCYPTPIFELLISHSK